MPDSLDPDSQQLLNANMETALYLNALAANVGSTACLVVPQALDYVVYCYVVCTNSGGGDTVPAISIGYTDDFGANSTAMNMPGAPTAGQHGATVTTFYATSGSNITYTVSGGVFTGGSTYSVRMIVRII